MSSPWRHLTLTSAPLAPNRAARWRRKRHGARLSIGPAAPALPVLLTKTEIT